LTLHRPGAASGAESAAFNAGHLQEAPLWLAGRLAQDYQVPLKDQRPAFTDPRALERAAAALDLGELGSGSLWTLAAGSPRGDLLRRLALELEGGRSARSARACIAADPSSQCLLPWATAQLAREGRMPEALAAWGRQPLDPQSAGLLALEAQAAGAGPAQRWCWQQALQAVDGDPWHAMAALQGQGPDGLGPYASASAALAALQPLAGLAPWHPGLQGREAFLRWSAGDLTGSSAWARRWELGGAQATAYEQFRLASRSPARGASVAGFLDEASRAAGGQAWAWALAVTQWDGRSASTSPLSVRQKALLSRYRRDAKRPDAAALPLALHAAQPEDPQVWLALAGTGDPRALKALNAMLSRLSPGMRLTLRLEWLAAQTDEPGQRIPAGWHQALAVDAARAVDLSPARRAFCAIMLQRSGLPLSAAELLRSPGGLDELAGTDELKRSLQEHDEPFSASQEP
jgi:hypothetical protein